MIEQENVPFALSNQNRRSLDARVGKVEIFDEDFELVDALYGNFIRCDPGVTEVTFDESIQDGFTATLHNVTDDPIAIPVARDLPPGSSLELQRVAGEWRTVGGTAEVPEAGFDIQPISDQSADILLTPDGETAALIDDPDFGVRYEGNGAITFGTRATDSDTGTNGLTVGPNNEASANFNFVVGEDNVASENQCVAIGSANNIESVVSFGAGQGLETSDGGYSFVTGFSNTITRNPDDEGDIRHDNAFTSFIAGQVNTITNSNSSLVAGASNDITNSDGSVIFGAFNEITQPVTSSNTGGVNYSIIAGSNNTITGGNSQGSLITGFQNTANNSRESAIFGRGNDSIDSRQTLIAGRGNTINGGDQAPVALGLQNTVSGQGGVAIGRGNTSSAERAVAIGRSLIASTVNQAVLGQWNVDYSEDDNTDPILQVGIGADADNREDALLIEKNGIIRIQEPTLNNDPTQIITRNDSTGELEYTDASEIGGSSVEVTGSDGDIQINNAGELGIANEINSNTEFKIDSNSGGLIYGNENTASGVISRAHGASTTASGTGSHAEGQNTIASGNYSHVEGNEAEASGQASHAEGGATEASGTFSHAEGQGTIASGNYSHSQGYDTIASEFASFVAGIWNEDIPDDAAGDVTPDNITESSTIFQIGNGTDDTERNDAVRVTYGGDIIVDRDVSVGRNVTLEQTPTENTSPTQFITRNGTTGEFEYTDPADFTTAIDFGTFIVEPTDDGQTITISGLDFRPDKFEFNAQAGIETLNVGKSGYGNNSTASNYQGSAEGFAKELSDGTFEQFTQHSGGSGASINAVGFYSSDSECLSIRYANKNGGVIGRLRLSINSVTSDGFILDATEVDLDDLSSQVVTYKAYRTK